MGKYRRGLTFGAFDVFHKGHHNLLTKAQKLCDRLVVFVSSDEYIFKHKGHVPVHSLKMRKKIIKSYFPKIEIDTQDLNFGKSDAVWEQNPNVLFVGDDWDKKTYTGEGLGVPVIYLPYTKGISSTIIRKDVQHRLP